MGLISEAQLHEALDNQAEKRLKDRLGQLLQEMGICTKDNIDSAVSIQEGYRSEKKHIRAQALADVATHRRKIAQKAHVNLMRKSQVVLKKTLAPGQLNVRDIARHLTPSPDES